MKKKKRELNRNLPADMSTEQGINTDPFGSWTGTVTEDEYEIPIQDVDDL